MGSLVHVRALQFCSDIDVFGFGLRFENNYLEGFLFLKRCNHPLFLVFEKEYHSAVLPGRRFMTVLLLSPLTSIDRRKPPHLVSHLH